MGRKQLSGMPGFTLVWFGQFLSLLGSGMTTFAISIWAWQETGSATALTLAVFFGFGPTILFSPFAGALVDRYDRKLMIILSDIAAGLSTAALLILYSLDALQIWHIYVANAFAGTFAAFQFPAYSAAVTNMIKKEQYARASGMMSLAESASGIFSPLAAGALIAFIGVGGIMAIDLITMSIAICVLLFVHIPKPAATEEGLKSRGSLWKESGFGFRYILARPSLFWLQMTFFAINFIAMLSFVLVTPMILARTGNNELLLGSVMSIGSVGGVLGGLLLSAWGGPKRRIHGVLTGMILIAIVQSFYGFGQTFLAWAAASFGTAFFLPILNGSNQAIWQSKVAPDVQGRVFSVRRLIAQITAPTAILLAGPLADRVFEPAMAPGGVLADGLGDFVGVGPGSGMALMFVISGMLGIFVGLAGYLFPVVRQVEILLPDHDTLQKAAAIDDDRQQSLQTLLEKRQNALMQPDSTERRQALSEVTRQMRKLGRQHQTARD